MLRSYLFFFTFLSVLLISGCTSKRTVFIKTVEPAKVNILSEKKHMAVTEFQNDRIGLSGKIEATLADARVDGKKYFTLINRQQIERVLSEQKLQSSAIIDPSTVSKIGEIIGVQAIVTGEIISATGTTRRYIKSKRECLRYYKEGRGCARWHFYNVVCHVTTATVSANISITDVETAEILYGDLYNEFYNADSCQEDNKAILSRHQAINELAKTIAEKFTLKLIPHYVYRKVPLLERLDTEEATSSQERQFYNALKYIEAGRLQKAERILQELLDELNGDSAVIAYDLGVAKEAMGKLKEAQRLYLLADEKTSEPLEEINQAVLRIQETINKQKQIDKQLDK